MKLIKSYFLFFFIIIACQPNQNNSKNTNDDTLTNVSKPQEKDKHLDGDIDARIIHTVAFTLSHDDNSPEAREFLKDARRLLSSIPTVQQFDVRKETSSKNNFEYGFSMKFADQNAYNTYNEHPIHVDFVENRWKKEVIDFIELDYIIID